MKQILLALLVNLIAVAARPCAANGLADDQSAIALHIAALSDSDSAIRAKAAHALRRIVAKYPGDTVNIATRDHGEAFWREKIKLIKTDMTGLEINKILPYFKHSTDDGGAFGGGRITNELRRLDYHWRVEIRYDDSGLPPTLIAQEMLVDVPVPPKYSGRWINYYVNGRKYNESYYRNGKYDGRVTYYYDNGRKMTEGHLVNGEAEGEGRRWFRDGRRERRGYSHKGEPQGIEKEWWLNGRLHSLRRFEKGKPIGSHTGWFENGQVHWKENYRNGDYDGTYTVWQSNGRKEFETHFLNGRKNGIETQWDEQGAVIFRNEYRNGEVVYPGPSP